MPFLRVFGRDCWSLGDFRNFRGVPEAEGSPCRFPGARGAEREYLRRWRPLPTQLLSPLPLLRPLVLPTLPVSLLLSLPSCLPIAGASPRSPVRCGECGFVSREPVLLSGGCRRFGISGVSGDRSQYCDVAFAAQQGPHAVALHADLDFVSFGEHRFDLLEKQTVRKLHHGRGFADSPPKIVRQASSAAAASGRHSR